MTPLVETPTVPKLITQLPGPKAAALIARDDQVLSPSYTRDYPLVAHRGRGCVLEDIDGNLFLDFTAGIAVTATGHAHPRVVAAAVEQAERLLHMSGTDFYYQAEIELAERLAKLAPGNSPKRVLFTNSGAESVEAAIKLARYATGRHRLISFFGAFHGRTYGAMSLGGSKSLHQRGFGPMLPGIHRLAYDCTEREVNELFARVVPPDEVAAIVVEPLQGEGGYRVPRADFLPMLREVCDRHGILLVVDEIQAGIGRTGKMFACQHFNVVPDIVCLAKGLASGMPLGAIVSRADVMCWPPGSHASTFGGNPVSCQAALATLELVEKEYLDNTVIRGRELREGLERIAREVPHVANARGLGLMLAVDLVHRGEAAPVRRNAVVQEAFRRGLLLLGCGTAGIRFCPGLCVTSEQIATALSIFREACTATADD